MCVFGRALRSADGRVLATATAHRASRYSRGRQDVSALRDSVDEDTRKDAILRLCVFGSCLTERERIGEKLAIKSSVDNGRSGLLFVAELRRPKTGWVEGGTSELHTVTIRD
jgi:hypothetical protein